MNNVARIANFLPLPECCVRSGLDLQMLATQFYVTVWPIILQSTPASHGDGFKGIE